MSSILLVSLTLILQYKPKMNLRVKLKPGAFATFAKDASCVRLSIIYRVLSVYFTLRSKPQARALRYWISLMFSTNHNILKVINFNTQIFLSGNYVINFYARRD
jgi:hypothetical protein